MLSGIKAAWVEGSDKKIQNTKFKKGRSLLLHYLKFPPFFSVAWDVQVYTPMHVLVITVQNKTFRLSLLAKNSLV